MASACVAHPCLTTPPRLCCSASGTGVESSSLGGKKLSFGKLLQHVTLTNSGPKSSRIVVAVLANEKPKIQFDRTTAVEFHSASQEAPVQFVSVDHVGSLCQNIERSLEFYVNVLGLTLNPVRPTSLPYRGAWLWVGSQMIHLMELDNPDPLNGRPAYGGRDRHVCLLVKDVEQMARRLEKGGEDRVPSCRKC
eukprot:TRINITY_DN3002_c0_g1_i5.p1 TRINITY_DN3002_c0_g1~~TRINITY_DN3002_c0_g1_i5.p1  ORF type:complete len:193 (+),score=17.78 TRINITY_DN3002_c0_g1_i5:267-845(+)